MSKGSSRPYRGSCQAGQGAHHVSWDPLVPQHIIPTALGVRQNRKEVWQWGGLSEKAAETRKQVLRVEGREREGEKVICVIANVSVTITH